MQRFAAIVVTLLLAFWLPGCSLFKKNTNSGGGGGGGSDPLNNAPPPKFPTAEKDPLKGQTRNDTLNNSGTLAGHVFDGSGPPPAGTSILVVNAEAKDDPGRELAVSPQGFFTIENLERGGQYKLIARGKHGDRAVAGIHYATAPNIHVTIQMKEDLVSTTTPGVPGPFCTLPKDDNKFQPLTPKKDVAKEGWKPALGVDSASGEVVLPAVQVAVTPEGFTKNGSGWVTPPPLAISPPKAKDPEFAKVTPPIDVPSRGVDTPASLGAAQVPSCVLVGQQLVNFALNDINGEPWEFKANRKGKLVLLDFWGTWCMPCRRTLPTLKGLQTKYGSQGLEVIGIAYEHGGTPQEQAHKVNGVCQNLLINYRQLLGSGPNCVVRNQLRVQGYPTLILLDDQGNILWRHAGELGRTDAEELERLIQSKARNVAGF